MLRFIALFISLGVIAFGSIGCTYNGALRDQFHAPINQMSGGIPVKVGLIVDDSEIRSNMDIIKYNVNVNPGLRNAMAAELATIFKEVVLVSNAKQTSDALLLARVGFESVEVSAHSFTCRISLSLQDPQTDLIVATYQHSEPYTSSYPEGRP